MSDPEKIPPMSRENAEALAEQGRKLQDRCPGASMPSGRQRCDGVVLQWRHGATIYRNGLCARCVDLERSERMTAKAARLDQREDKKPRFAKYGAR